MLSPTFDTIRLFFHVLSAAIWVGGQITLAGVVPVLRREHPGSTQGVARSFARLAWPSFAVLVVTGGWNLVEVDIVDSNWDYLTTVLVHVATAFAAAVLTLVHSLGRSRIALALGGALGAAFSLSALFIGVLMKTGT